MVPGNACRHLQRAISGTCTASPPGWLHPDNLAECRAGYLPRGHGPHPPEGSSGTCGGGRSGRCSVLVQRHIEGVSGAGGVVEQPVDPRAKPPTASTPAAARHRHDAGEVFSSMVAFDQMNRTRVTPAQREERGKLPRTGGSCRRRAGSAHGVRHDARIRRRILGRPSHILRPRREARRHQRRFGASRCARSSCRCRCSRDRGVCSGPSPLRPVRPCLHLHNSCNCQHSPSTR
jgi:hypothetical protein